jgi:uracil-DNA glycosylase
MDLIWKNYINREEKKDYYRKLLDFIEKEYNSFIVFPNKQKIFDSLNLCPFSNIKCVIVGQDPYHEEGQAQGLAFSVPDNIKTPPSLKNIIKELELDLNIKRKGNSLEDLPPKGVLLINRVLTVRQGEANSHRNKGWEIFTRGIIELISRELGSVVFILWGKNAENLGDIIDSRHLVIRSPHPSPLSAYRGFFGSKPFSRANDFLNNKGIGAINWGNM